MIGSHNSLTCFEPKHWWWKPFSFIWRCQGMPFDNQLKAVDFFDIRVRYDKKGQLRCCHGLVDLDCYEGTHAVEFLIFRIASYGKTCRVILERGEDKGLLDFLRPYVGIHNPIKTVVVKKGWKVLYSASDERYCKDYSYVPFHSDKPWWKQLGQLKLSTPKRWAKKHNPVIGDNVRQSVAIYFMDYVTEKGGEDED